MKDLTLFRAWGIPVRLHWSWFFIFALLSYSLATGYFPSRLADYPSQVLWATGIAASLLLFVSVLLHEMAHSLVARYLGLPIAGITLFLFGGVSELPEEPTAPGRELKMAAAGPAMSFMLALAAAAALRLPGVSSAPPLRELLSYTAGINAMLGVFNILPGFPLDGGRMLRAALWRYTGNLQKATRQAAAVGKVMAMALVGLGVLAILGRDPFTGIWFIILGLFLQQAAHSGYQNIVLKKFLAGLPVEQLMVREVVSVSPDVPVTRLVEDYMLRFHHDTFPVVWGAAPIGLVKVAQVKLLPRDRWDLARTRDIMARDIDRLVMSPATSTDRALELMLREGWGLLPVVDGGRLVGVVSLHDVMHYIQLRSDLSE